jgi:hypothetical protein
MMKSRFLFALIVSAVLTAGAERTAIAQDRGPEASAVTSAAPNSPRSIPEHATDSARNYDARALRFEASWGNVRIIRGANGPVLGTVGWFRDFDLEKLLAGSPSAVTEARAYQTANFRGSLVGGIGAATMAVGVLVAANSSNNASSPVLVIAGAGAMLWGAQHLSTSYSALSRALWWYNRDLTR